MEEMEEGNMRKRKMDIKKSRSRKNEILEIFAYHIWKCQQNYGFFEAQKTGQYTVCNVTNDGSNRKI